MKIRAPIKKFNNQLGDDIGKIDVQEGKGEIDMRGGMIDLPNSQTKNQSSN